jgi:hypothetical protein
MTEKLLSWTQAAQKMRKHYNILCSKGEVKFQRMFRYVGRCFEI